MQKEPVPSPLSFDTSLIKFFCKTPDTEKTTYSQTYYKKPSHTPQRTSGLYPTNGRVLFETDPSFDEISTELIKSMGNNEEVSFHKDKFDGRRNIL